MPVQSVALAFAASVLVVLTVGCGSTQLSPLLTKDYTANFEFEGTSEKLEDGRWTHLATRRGGLDCRVVSVAVLDDGFTHSHFHCAGEVDGGAALGPLDLHFVVGSDQIWLVSDDDVGAAAEGVPIYTQPFSAHEESGPVVPVPEGHGLGRQSHFIRSDNTGIECYHHDQELLDESLNALPRNSRETYCFDDNGRLVSFGTSRSEPYADHSIHESAMFRMSADAEPQPAETQ